MARSYVQIVNDIKELCAAHPQIRSCIKGDILDVVSEEEVEYTACIFNIAQITPSMSINKQELIIDMFIGDRTFEDQSNRLSIENNTAQITQDLLNVIFYSDRWQQYGDFSLLNPARLYYDRTLDRLTGWRTAISYKIVGVVNYDDLPFQNYNYNRS